MFVCINFSQPLLPLPTERTSFTLELTLAFRKKWASQELPSCMCCFSRNFNSKQSYIKVGYFGHSLLPFTIPLNSSKMRTRSWSSSPDSAYLTTVVSVLCLGHIPHSQLIPSAHLRCTGPGARGLHISPVHQRCCSCLEDEDTEVQRGSVD